jgi:hypothetical protein
MAGLEPGAFLQRGGGGAGAGGGEPAASRRATQAPRTKHHPRRPRVESFLISYRVDPRSCLVAIWHMYPEGQFAFAQNQRGTIWHAGCNGAGVPRFFAGGGREGHCEHDGGPGASNL